MGQAAVLALETWTMCQGPSPPLETRQLLCGWLRKASCRQQGPTAREIPCSSASLGLRPPTAVQADVGGALLLRGAELAAKPRGRRLLGQALDVHAAAQGMGGWRGAEQGPGLSACGWLLPLLVLPTQKAERHPLTTCLPAGPPAYLVFSPLTTTRHTGLGAAARAERVKPCRHN